MSKKDIKGFADIINWLENVKKEGTHTVEYEYNKYAKDIYGSIDNVRFTVGGIGLVESFDDDRILEYLVVIYRTANKRDNTNDKYRVEYQNEVIKLLEDRFIV